MNEEEKKTDEETSPKGAVEVKEEDLDQASGGAGYKKTPPSADLNVADASVKVSPTLKPTDPNYDLKNYDLKKL